MPKSEDCFQFFLNDSLKSENTNTCCWRAIFIDTFVKAAKEAGITKISHVDEKSTGVLGLFAKYTVTVYGE